MKPGCISRSADLLGVPGARNVCAGSLWRVGARGGLYRVYLNGKLLGQFRARGGISVGALEGCTVWDWLTAFLWGDADTGECLEGPDCVRKLKPKRVGLSGRRLGEVML